MTLIEPAGGTGHAPAPLLMLPGTLCDGRVFAPLIECLPGCETRICATIGARSAKAMAALILATAPPSFILVGFSLGGIIALQIAAVAPERVVGLVLIASTARADGVGEAPRRADLAEAAILGVGRFVLERLWIRYVAQASRNEPALRNVVLDMAESIGLSGLADQTEIAIGRDDSLGRLGSLAMPVLVIGGQEDVICPPELQHEIARAAPKATLCLLPGMGHFVLLEAPRTVAGHVRAWFAHLPAHTRPVLSQESICQEST